MTDDRDGGDEDKGSDRARIWAATGPANNRQFEERELDWEESADINVRQLAEEIHDFAVDCILEARRQGTPVQRANLAAKSVTLALGYNRLIEATHRRRERRNRRRPR